MTLTELVERLAEETGSEIEVVWGFSRSFMDVLIDELDRGNEIKIRGLGTFKWMEVPKKSVPEPGKMLKRFTAPAGKKLKFYPAKKFQTRRTLWQTKV